MKTVEIFTKEDLINFKEKEPNGFLRALQDNNKLKWYDSDYDKIEEQIKISDVIGAIGKDGVLSLEQSYDDEIKRAKENIKNFETLITSNQNKIKRMQASCRKTEVLK